jgi:hypothetical protein
MVLNKATNTINQDSEVNTHTGIEEPENDY